MSLFNTDMLYLPDFRHPMEGSGKTGLEANSGGTGTLNLIKLPSVSSAFVIPTSIGLTGTNSSLFGPIVLMAVLNA